jgi:hypothetical protein
MFGMWRMMGRRILLLSCCVAIHVVLYASGYRLVNQKDIFLLAAQQ